MLLIYRILTTLFAPIARWRLSQLAKQTDEFAVKQHPTRSGHFPDSSAKKPPLWFHAASVGEIKMLQPLIDAIGIDHTSALITTFTPTGLMQGKALWGGEASYAFAPLDQYHHVCRWLDHVQPRILIVAETELWPELFAQCHKRQIPIIIVNARLSPKHLRRYQRWSPLFGHAIKSIALVACQSHADAERWASLGLESDRIVVTGNLKAAAQQPPHPPKRLTTAFTWTAGSIHPGEFSMIASTHQRLLTVDPEAKLIVAPRHLVHLSKLTETLEAMNLSWVALDPNQDPPQPQTASVGVLTAMGQLEWGYGQADVAFVGGSLVSVGGHNLYEPARLGLPVIAGTHLSHQQAMSDRLTQAGGLIQVNDPAGLTEALVSLADDPQRRKTVGEQAKSVATEDAQSLESTIEAIKPWLDKVRPAHAEVESGERLL